MFARSVTPGVSFIAVRPTTLIALEVAVATGIELRNDEPGDGNNTLVISGFAILSLSQKCGHLLDCVEEFLGVRSV